MKDLTSGRLMALKAALLLAIGLVSAALLLAAAPKLSTAVLLALCIWSFSRVYYFAFYVIERYIDPSFRFSGLLSAVRWIFGVRRPKSPLSLRSHDE